MKVKKTVLIVAVAIAALIAVLFLTSCSLFGSSDTIVPPTIKNVSLLKTTDGYTESKEYLYNKETDNAMALGGGDSFLISIEYENPKNYAISYLKLNGEKLLPKQFETGSNKLKTIIKVTVPESTGSSEEVYSIGSIFYNTGSETKKLAFNDEFDMNFTVKINPSYVLTLDYQNTDRRSSTKKPEDDISSGNKTTFGELMSAYGVADADYASASGLPAKEGGWIFEGWYTQPNGDGILVSANDTYYFWSNITLYAYYTRAFEYEIVDLAQPIEYEYLGTKIVNGQTTSSKGKKTFTRGAIITKDNTRGKHPKVEIYDTIVDEKLVLSQSGVNTITAVEYPVIKVANKAFSDVNNIVELRIGQFVEEIGYYAFNNCNSLRKVTFADNSRLKYIGDYAFQSTKVMGITDTFTLPESVVYLGNFAFRYSGWSNTTNNGVNESVLHIYPRYKFIGFGCFMQTGFSQVIFEPGCHYESQIGFEEGKATETAGGWKDIKTTLNRIGGNIFAGCVNIMRIEFLNDLSDPENKLYALNIIPDRAFDGDRYSVKGIEAVIFNEGLEEIGDQAFYYQRKLLDLSFPNTLREIGKEAFYMCDGVLSINFMYESQLEILRTKCFGNLANIDRVEITSSVFKRYGNGPFANCSRLKSIEFPNINDPTKVPTGFSEEEDSDEVMPNHYYSDLLYGTFETGADDSEATDGEQTKSSYSMPTRVFCAGTVTNAFREWLVKGKEMYVMVGGKPQSTGTATYQSSIFINDISLVFEYQNPTKLNSEPDTVDIALQEVYNIGGSVIGYSLVYWSNRSKIINLPDISSFPTIPVKNVDIIEIGMYALPTSVEEIVIPESIKRLEHDAFNGCVNLNTIRFVNNNSNNLEYIGDYAFFGTAITSFESGMGLKVIGQNAFMRCRSLRWVDLSKAAIQNPVQGRMKNIELYKYEYEITEHPKDYANTLYDGAFQGCIALSWISMPANLLQMNNALFTSCSSLYTVIINSKTISTSTSATDDNTFYANSVPTAIYDSKTMPYMTLYVDSGTLLNHKAILAETFIKKYEIIERAPNHS